MIVPKQGGGKAGIFATQILDTIETDVQLNTHLLGDQQVRGSAVIQDHLTLFINTDALLESAGVYFEADTSETPFNAGQFSFAKA
jgi:hypothetical protein